MAGQCTRLDGVFEPGRSLRSPFSAAGAAALAPVFGIAVADFDGDGNEDVFLSQNIFGVPPEVSRYDAGRGVLLRGDGKGAFKSVPGTESGLLIYGEGRGAAVSDYDGDGRVDLVRWPKRRPDQVVPERDGKAGPARALEWAAVESPGHRRDLTAGVQDGRLGLNARCVLESDTGHRIRRFRCWAKQRKPAYLDVTWPGGKSSRVALPPGRFRLW